MDKECRSRIDCRRDIGLGTERMAQNSCQLINGMGSDAAHSTRSKIALEPESAGSTEHLSIRCFLRRQLNRWWGDPYAARHGQSIAVDRQCSQTPGSIPCAATNSTFRRSTARKRLATPKRMSFHAREGPMVGPKYPFGPYIIQWPPNAKADKESEEIFAVRRKSLDRTKITPSSGFRVWWNGSRLRAVRAA